MATATAAQERKAARVAELQETLAQSVEDLLASGQWQQWLDFLASFHRYSFNNTVLIMRQCPEASLIAGFRAWQDKGRQVRKGEKGIKIFGKPFRTIKETDKVTGEVERLIVPVRPPVVTVFDISQTDPIEGAEQAADPVAPLTGDDPRGIYAALADHMNSKGWTVTREQITGPANGYCTVDGSKTIVVDSELSAAHAAKTLIHEAGHAILHTDDEGKLIKGPGSSTREIEAESTAYVVAAIAGLDTSDYSTGYVASWSGGDPEAIRAAGVRIQKAVHELADTIGAE